MEKKLDADMSVKEALEAIRKGLEEDKAFLELSLLDPDPDARPAEEARIQNVLVLAGVMEEILEHMAPDKEENVIEHGEEENRRFDENLEKRQTEIKDACEEAETAYREDYHEADDEDDSDISLRYETHTLGRHNSGDNIEYDWTVDKESECFIEGKGKTGKKNKKKKKEKKNKKEKSKKKNKK